MRSRNPSPIFEAFELREQLRSAHLYVATVRLADGDGEVHAESVRFGRREFSVFGSAFRLNGKRVFIRGAFREGLYPATPAQPRDLEIVRRELRMAREAGFKLPRPWCLPAER